MSTGPIYVLNGPNLNLLGQRQPDIYGRETLDDVAALCAEVAGRHGRSIELRQSNHEGVLVDWVQEARERASGVVINPAAYTHTSVALRDALVTLEIPVVEVHISNVHAREEFRQHSYVSPVVTGTIAGLGVAGYGLAVEFVCSRG